MLVGVNEFFQLIGKILSKTFWAWVEPWVGPTTLFRNYCMNCFKLLVAPLIALVFLVSAAAYHPRAETSINDPAVYRIIQEGDHPEELVAAFRGRWVFYDNFHGLVLPAFKEMISRGRIMSVAHCLPRIHFPKPSDRDYFLTSALTCAFNAHNMAIVDLLLAQDFQFMHRREHYSFWMPLAWSQGEVMQLIKNHPRHVAVLVPTSLEFLCVKTMGDAMFLVELARHCYEVFAGLGKPEIQIAGLSELLDGLIRSRLVDDEMAAVTRCLLDMGAKVEPHHLISLNINLEQTIELLRQYQAWQKEGDVKDPGMD